MDYDENDFQGQNLQVTGEGNTEFPPDLQPYPLPKFEFEDSLQGHLRFDSLVETEVFLGIESQEDNHWIEDFSRGGTGIDFSPRAAESCSISRRKDAWSAATSSESVEMLLKSVGQEEMITGKAVIKDSDVHEEQRNLIKPMELTIEQDNNSLPEMGDIVDSTPTVSSGEFLGSFPHLSKDLEGKAMQGETALQTFGQEEMITGKTVIKDSDIHEEQGNVMKPMEPTIEQDNNSLPEMGDIVDSGLTVSSGEFLGSFPRMSEDLEVKAMQGETALQTFGQEEMITGKTVIKDADIHEEQGNLMKPLEPNIEQDNSRLPKMGDIVDSGPTVSSGEFLGSCPHLSEDLEGKAMQGVTALQTLEVESPTCRSSSNFDPKPVNEKCYLPDIAGSLLDGSKGNDVNCTEISLVHEPRSNRAEDSPLSEMQSNDRLTVGNSVTSTLNVIMAVGELSSQASTVISKGEPDQQVAEVCSRSPVQACQFEAMAAFCKDKERDDACNDERDNLPLAVEGSTTSEVHEHEAINSNVGNCAAPRTNLDSADSKGYPNTIDKKDDDLLEVGRQLDSAILGSNSEALQLSVKNSELVKGQSGENGSSDVELLGRRFDSENLNDVHDSPGICIKDSTPEDTVSSSPLDDSIELFEKKVVSSQINVLNCDQGDSVIEKGETKLSPDTSNVECQGVESVAIDQGPGYSPSCKFNTDDVNFGKSESDTAMGHESASSVALADDVLSPPKDGLTNHEIVDDKHIPVVESDQMDKKDEIATEVCTDSSLSTLENYPDTSSALDVLGGKESVSSDADPRSVSDAINLPLSAVESFNVKSCSEAQTAVTQEVTVCDSAVKAGIVAATMSLQNIDEEATKSYEEASLKISDPDKIPNKSEMFSVPLPSPSLESSCGDGPEDKQTSSVSEQGNGEQITAIGSGGNVLNALEGSRSPDSLPEDDSKSSVLESEEPEKPNCGSPTVISCIEISPTEKEMEVGTKGPADHNALVRAISDDGSIDKFSSVSPNLKGNCTHKDDKTFSFEVTPFTVLPDSCKPFSSIQADQPSVMAEGSHASSLNRTDSKVIQETTCGTPLISDSQIVRGGSKNVSEHKKRRVSGKATGKEATKKLNSPRETSVVRQPERGGGSCIVSPVQSVSRQLVQSEGMLLSGKAEHSNAKPSGALTTLTSDLPDLNASASPPSPGMLSQPFTDLQQVQLRAQIFVYGSLIQGGAPDEPCMVSAFGASDGGRSIWENTWLACVERVRGQKSHPNNLETPSQSCSGTRPLDPTSKHSSSQTKASSTLFGRGSNKFTPSAAINSMIAVPSPLWSTASPSSSVQQSSSMQRGAVQDYHQVVSPMLTYQSTASPSSSVQQSSSMQRGAIPDYHQVPSPMHTYQTPPLRNIVGHTSWLSQSPFPVSWIASQPHLTSAPDVSVRFSTVPITEAAQLTPSRDSSLSHSVVKHVSSSPTVQSVTFGSISGVSTPVDLKKGTMSSGQHPADLKRKRKKVLASEDPDCISLLSTQAESVLGTGVSSGPSIIFASTTPTCSKSKTETDEGATSVSPTSEPGNVRPQNQDGEFSVALSEETLNKVKEAKLQAEEAAAHASAAVNHSQEVWNQVDKQQKNSGLVSDVESALASAAAAVAAAASIAKAAAAAAKIASNAALQAKLMADEALVASESGNLNGNNLSHGMNSLGSATPASILNGVDGTSSAGSIIGAAKEASRKRVEAASAASKQAENLDALVRAAELAAEAVSQTGKIVAMGNPLPLNQLVEASPERGCLKSHFTSTVLSVKSNNLNRIQSTFNNLGKGPNIFSICSEGPLGKAETQIPTHVAQSTQGVAFRHSMENHVMLVDGSVESATDSGMELEEGKGHKISDSTITIGVVPDSEFGPGSASNSDQSRSHDALENLKRDIIEGSLVEVFKDGEGYKSAWFLANVLSVKDGKACLCYKELQSDEGLGQLKEWLPLHGEGDKAPRIRIGRAWLEGTRKRQRAAMRDYTWSVGDRVDVWMKDCWWEGVITEKKSDETAFTVHFQAQGETSVVKAWHLRPSLIWKDGKWIEWSRGNEFSVHEGDMPREKRPRLGSPAVKEKDKEDGPHENVDVVESGRHEESAVLSLSTDENIFNCGKASADIMKANKNKTQTGLRKEGTGVIFGVPKPGKKRKFMEVSKHYVADQRRNSNEVSGSKVEKYLLPQASGSRVASRVVAREKRAEDSKPKPVKSGKVQNVSSRSGIQKDNLLSPASSTHDYHGENPLRKQNASEFRSFGNSRGGAEGATVLTDVSSSKKLSMSNIKSEPVNRGKPGHSDGKLSKIEEDKVFAGNSEKATSEAVEPRRSNRRIQPTSRLLEGLQSSTMIISKIPSVSHDKGPRSQSKGGVTRGRNFKF